MKTWHPCLWSWWHIVAGMLWPRITSEPTFVGHAFAHVAQRQQLRLTEQAELALLGRSSIWASHLRSAHSQPAPPPSHSPSEAHGGGGGGGVQEGSAAALLTAAALHSFIHSLAAWKAVLYAWPCQAVASSSFPFWISNKCPENGWEKRHDLPAHLRRH